MVPVTAEAASSSLVVPAIHSKELAPTTLKPLRTQKGRARRPCCVLFFSFCYLAAASYIVQPEHSGASEEKTNDSTAAGTSCFAALIACV